ncbi:MAG: thioesterase family protein [Rhodospirillaceae bacterium]|nr:thioesterase family protein [Rhodospirillaceae bacterium]
MNLIFRFAWTMLAAIIRRVLNGPIGFMEEARYGFRCWPHDCDFNLHMTNSRYASFMDIARVTLMASNGAWRLIRAAKLLPVLGSNTIRFRRAVKPFQAFEVSARTICWDDKWIFLYHQLVVDGDVAAIGIAKVAFIGPQGRVPTQKLLEIVGYTGPALPPSAIPEHVNALDDVLKV